MLISDWKLEKNFLDISSVREIPSTNYTLRACQFIGIVEGNFHKSKSL